MGRQVAARMAQFGLQVWLCDRNPAVVADAFKWLRTVADQPPTSFAMTDRPGTTTATHSPKLHKRESDHPESDRSPSVAPTWLERIAAAPALDQLTAAEVAELQLDLVLECVPEQLSLKKRVLRQVSQLFPAPCIIASNSSYFVPSVTSKFIAAPQRFAHLHFHVPVLRESVCDIVGCSETETVVIERLVDMAHRIGQPPIQLRHEHPGYIFNWLLQSVLKGALELVALDVVEPQQVDQSWKAVTGMPLGPFGIMDQIGLDVVEQVLSNARWAEPATVTDQQLLDVIRPLIQAGKLGVKSHSGFYDYNTGPR